MKVILKALVGSHLYGLDTEDSDHDYNGVFVESTNKILSLHKPQETRVSKDPDSTMHEVEKFIRLAAKGNPTVLELLFCPEYIELTWEGKLLVKERKSFLSNHIRDSFGGYAYQQSTKFKSKYEKMQDMFGVKAIRELRQKYGEERWLGEYLQALSLGKTEEIILGERGEVQRKEPKQSSRVSQDSQNNSSTEVSSEVSLRNYRGTSGEDVRLSEGHLPNLSDDNARLYRPQSPDRTGKRDSLPEVQPRIRSLQRRPGLTERSCELFDIYSRYMKNARHCFRLLHQGKMLLETGDLNPVLSNPEDYFAVGELPVEALVDKFTQEYEIFKATQSVLPDEPDWAKLDATLFMIRSLNYAPQELPQKDE